MNDLSKKDVEILKKDVQDIIETLDIKKKKEDVALLEQESLKDNFWKDSKKAQETMEQISYLHDEITTIEALEKEILSLSELFSFENLSSKQEEGKELIEEYERLRGQLDKFSLRKFLSGKYDKLGSVLTIVAGQGGTESNDWVQMLYRMYTMFFDSQGWKYLTSNISKGSETGMSSVTIEIQEAYSFGMLKKEHGAHRLVRISPFNAQGLRQTTFAGVEVLPLFKNNQKEDDTLEIPEKDVTMKAVRSSGPGGQSVNKTSSAIQLTHIPTNITVHCSEQKSQAQNREKAMELLRAKLWRIKEEKEVEKISEIKGDYKEAAWGNQIRNYILHPYKLVKDLRTGVESKDPEDVLDGNIEKLLEAQVRLK